MSLKVIELDEISEEDFASLRSSVRVKAEEHLSDWADNQKLTTYELNSLRKGLASGTSVVGARLSGKLIGLAAVSKLAFDTEFFQFPMGRIAPLMLSDNITLEQRGIATKRIVEKTLLRAKKEGMKQLTLRVPPRDYDIIQTCMRMNFDFVDVLVTYTIDMKKVDEAKISPPADFVVRTKLEDDLRPLMRIAQSSFVKDRFHADKRFNQDKADQFHSKWIYNSLTGVAADEVIVAQVDGKPAGFTTLKLNRELSDAIGIRSGSMILSAVDDSLRGRGIYRHMIAGGLRWFKGKSDVVDLGTQIDNLPVQRAWCGLGFKPAAHLVTMHWWDIGS